VRIEGANVLVTGASSGIGAATARLVAERGGRPLLVARNEAALERLAREIEQRGGRARVYPADLSDAEAVERLAGEIDAAVGTPDVIVNNAGAGRFLFIDETDPEDAVRQMAVPYFAAFFVTRAFVEAMVRRGRGHIVNVNSPASRMAWPGASGYGVARWAIRGFTETLRADLAGTGVRVTEAIPAKVSSEYFENNPGSEERIPDIARLIPTISPERAAHAIVKGVERDAREVSVPGIYRAMAAQARLFPRLTAWLLRRTGSRRPSAAPPRREPGAAR
jgi:short-subunit dehydrogenase